MSVRMALAKLCACACGGAIIGGGAVHVVERQQPRPMVLKGLKSTKAKPTRVAHRPMAYRTVRRTTTCTPGTTTTTVSVADPGRYANLAAPYAGVPPVAAGAPYGQSPAAVPGGSAGGGFGGGFFGGYFGGGGSSGGVFVTSTGGTNTSTGGTNTSTGGTNTSTGGTNTSTGGTNTSTGGTNTSTGGTDTPPNPPTSSGSSGWNPPNEPPREVPAPPMLILFGAAAGALVLRRRLSGRGAKADAPSA